MTTNKAVSRPVDEGLKEIEARQTHLEGEIKGMKGQQGLIRKKIGLGRPGEALKESNQAVTGPVASETRPAEAPIGHKTYSWMKGCPGCGGAESAAFKTPPSAYCKTGGVPMAHIEKDDDLKGIKKCWNCDGVKVSTTPPKQVIF